MIIEGVHIPRAQTCTRGCTHPCSARTRTGRWAVVAGAAVQGPAWVLVAVVGALIEALTDLGRAAR